MLTLERPNSPTREAYPPINPTLPDIKWKKHQRLKSVEGSNTLVPVNLLTRRKNTMQHAANVMLSNRGVANI